MVHPAYAPSMNSEPCAKFSISIKPKISDKPLATKKNNEPSVSPDNKMLTAVGALIPRVARKTMMIATAMVMRRVRLERKKVITKGTSFPLFPLLPYSFSKRMREFREMKEIISLPNIYESSRGLGPNLASCHFAPACHRQSNNSGRQVGSRRENFVRRAAPSHAM